MEVILKRKPMKIIKRTVGDIAADLKRAKDRKQPGTMLIGAGCSVTADIPSATGFVQRIKNNPNYQDAYKRAEEPKGYQDVMAALTSGVRHDFIEKYVKDAKLNWTHLLLGHLVKEEFIGRILTTNFDNLVVRALALYNIFPAVYDLAASPDFRPDFIKDPSIFHLHGQAAGFVQCHSRQETGQQAKKIPQVFGDSSVGRPWVIVGYSGDNDPMFENLAEIERFEYGLYWVQREGDKLSEGVKTRLLDHSLDKQAYLVTISDADAFFMELHQKLNLSLPDYIKNPFGYVSDILKGFADSTESGGPDYCKNPLKMLDDADRCFIQGVKDCPRKKNEKQKLEFEQKARNLLFQGNYDEVLKLLPEDEHERTEELKDSAAWAYIVQGNELLKQAKTTSGREADRLFSQAGEKYQQALAIKPDKHEALNNWGITLSEQAKTTSGEEAERLFSQAGDKYQDALAIKPDFHEALNNWGNALADQAKTKSGEEADRLFSQACEKYQQALAIKPDKHEALNNWGTSLLEQAKTRSGEEAERLFALAGDKYQQALAIKPDSHEALHNWGVALANQARTRSGEEADRFFSQACEKYQDALAIKPDSHEALHNWGITLSEQAKTRSGEEADRLFSQAVEKFQQALAIKPDKHESLYNWGNTLGDQAETTGGEEAERLFAQAGEKYQQALAIKPDDHKVLNNWGNALADQAKTKSGEEADRLFSQACEKFQQVLAIKPDDYESLNNWGTSLLEQAKTKSGEEVDRLFSQAGDKYQQALAIKPDFHGTLFNLACFHGLQGQVEECLTWLHKRNNVDPTLTKNDLDKDTDFDAVRSHPDFKKFRETLPNSR